MIENVDFGYSVMQYIRFRIEKTSVDDVDMKTALDEANQIEQQIDKLIEENEELKGLFLKYQDSRSYREEKFMLFSLELGMEMATRMFQNLGLM